MPFDMSQVQRGARNRRTPYYEATQRYDPKGFTVYNHMYFPIRFDTFEAEFEALLNDVTIWDVSVERCLEISGPDGFRFAQLLTPRDLSRCAVGQAKYVLDLRSRRRDRQRPGPDPDGRDHVLVRARVLGRPALRARAAERLPGPRRDDQGGRRRAAAGPGPQVQAAHGEAARRGDPRPPVLLLDRGQDRRGAGGDHADRLDVRGRLRGLPHRLDEGLRGLRGAHGRRPRVRHPADRPERHPAHRGRDLQLGRRHDLRGQPPRDGPRAPGRLGSRGRREHLDEGPARDQGAGRRPADQRRRARRRSVPRAEQRQVAGGRGRRADRHGHLGDPLSAPRHEHRLRVAPGGALGPRRDRDASGPSGEPGPPPSPRCRSSTRASRSRSRRPAGGVLAAPARFER